VLHHGDAAGGEHEDGGGGDVEEVQPVAAGAADVEQRLSDGVAVDAGDDGAVEEGGGEGPDLGRGLATVRQGGEEVRLRPGRDGFVEQGDGGRLDPVGRELALCCCVGQILHGVATNTVASRLPTCNFCPMLISRAGFAGVPCLRMEHRRSR